ncbi:MAG TPA: L,D-transpeptidase [Xanthobacteraceae bacterium]|nr:L,D-transpeptidase [Xanthobacteraceae bacterium]
MRHSPKCWNLLIAAIAALVFFACGAQAQYDRYDRSYQRYDQYDRYYRHYAPYGGYARRDWRRPPPDEFHREPVRHKKPKHPAKPTKKAEEKSAKGPFQIVVSIATQRIYLYGADGLVRESKVSTGMRGHSTPTGIFSVIGKDYYHRSNIYSGAPMPLMQRITWSGIALHQGVLPGYPASHGCIRMTASFAKFLWHTVKRDTRVIVVRSEIEPPAPITSPKLFVPIANPVEQTKTATLIAKDVVKEEAPLLQVAAIEAAVETKPSETVSSAGKTERNFYKPPIMPARKGHVAVFISRKTGKLYVRYANTPLFEAPIKIKDKEQLIGTHVFTAIEPSADGKEMKWVSVSIPTPIETKRPRKNSRRQVADIADKSPVPAGPQTAARALERIEIPKDAAEKIGVLLSPGSSLTISDYGMSDETGDGTEFIIRTR